MRSQRFSIQVMCKWYFICNLYLYFIFFDRTYYFQVSVPVLTSTVVLGINYFVITRPLVLFIRYRFGRGVVAVVIWSKQIMTFSLLLNHEFPYSEWYPLVFPVHTAWVAASFVLLINCIVRCAIAAASINDGFFWWGMRQKISQKSRGGQLKKKILENIRDL